MDTTPTAPGRHRVTPVSAAIALVFGIGLLGYMVWLLRAPIKLVIISALLALALSHPISWLTRRRVPRPLAVVLMLVVVVAIIGVALFLFVPALVHQAAGLTNNLPIYWNQLREQLQDLTRQYPWISERIGEANLSDAVTKKVEGLATAGVSFAWALVNTITLTIILLAITLFILINPRPLAEGILGAVPDPWSGRARHIAGLLLDRVRAWLRGLLILGTIIGLMDGIGLTVLGVPYAALFAVFCGLMEAVPTLGPVIAAIPAILVALAVGGVVKALAATALFICVQQIENLVLVPLIMKRALQVHPVSTMFGFLALGTLFGLFGAVIAVPMVACLKVLYDEIYYPWAHPSDSGETSAAGESPSGRRRSAQPDRPAGPAAASPPGDDA